MGKQGPCCHCGVTSTPLWRNGPPSKPVLCNACGSRWRTKGSLVNYTPLHARGHTFPDLENTNNSGWGRAFCETNPDGLHVTDELEDNLESAIEISKYDAYSETSEKDAGGGSTSESGISYSASYALFDNTDGIENTGSVQSPAWDSPVPSKKRTCLKRKSPSSIEKLQKDLYDILCEDSSCLSESSEEVLLFQSPASVGSVETVLGSVLIKHTRSIGEESEGSSISENKQHQKSESCSGLSSCSFHSHSFGAMSTIGEEE